MKITKKLDLDLSGIPRDKRTEAKQAVGELILEETLIRLSKGESPVDGEKFAKLSEDYAKQYKGGDRTPNLELTGDMLDAFSFKTTSNGIEIGIFDDGEGEKADGHNQFSGRSTPLPKRRFIPDEDQSYKEEILRRANRILDGYRDDRTANVTRSASTTNRPVQTEITLDDILSDDFIGSLFGES